MIKFHKRILKSNYDVKQRLYFNTDNRDGMEGSIGTSSAVEWDVLRCYVIMYYVTIRDIKLDHGICYVMLCYFMWCYSICYAIIYSVMLCYGYSVSCYVMLYYIMLCYAILYYAMLYYVMLYCVMLCSITLCYIMDYDKMLISLLKNSRIR